MWLYILYYNLFINNLQTLYTLCDENNNKYKMVDFSNILDHNLSKILINELNNINYFKENKYIGSNFYNNKNALLVIPDNYIKYITYNPIILKPKLNNSENNNIKKKFINLNNINNLYLKEIYNHKINNINIPLYLLLNNINDIKVNILINDINLLI
jgi:hypothetical protein